MGLPLRWGCPIPSQNQLMNEKQKEAIREHLKGFAKYYIELSREFDLNGIAKEMEYRVESIEFILENPDKVGDWK